MNAQLASDLLIDNSFGNASQKRPICILKNFRQYQETQPKGKKFADCWRDARGMNAQLASDLLIDNPFGNASQKRPIYILKNFRQYQETQAKEKNSRIVGATPDMNAQLASDLLIDNPFGNASQKRPICILKNFRQYQEAQAR